jgi:peptidylprolyl isomerase
VRAMTSIIVACAAIAFAGCGDGDSTTTGSSGAAPAETKSPSASSGAAGRKPVVEVPAGAPPKRLVKRDLIEGEGEEAASGDEVTVQYVGVGYDSEEEFDTSWGKEPFTFTLGSGMVIPGWERGVEGMKVGGRRELRVPPNLAYGAAGFPPSIGPNEALVFVVDLVEVE